MSAPAPTTGSAPSASRNNGTPVTDIWRYMRVRMVDCVYKWTIDNFTLRKEKMGEFFCSDTFSDNSDDKSEWCLEIFPRGNDEDSEDSEVSEDDVSLYLTLNSCHTPEVPAQYKFSILNSKGEKTNSVESTHRFSKGDSWGEETFVKRDFLITNAIRLLPDNKLTIYCEVSIIKEFGSISQFGESNFDISQRKLSKDMKSILKDQKFCDITLSAEGQDFQVHKAVLAGRSPIFAAMFEHEMKEMKENRVVITDIDPEVLGEMLRYIYTGKPGKIEKLAEGLLAAADKYDLGVLKQKCAEVLGSKLTINNAAYTLILADLYNVEELKKKTINFIVLRAKDVMNTAMWKNMIPTHPHLIGEAFRALATL